MDILLLSIVSLAVASLIIRWFMQDPSIDTWYKHAVMLLLVGSFLYIGCNQAMLGTLHDLKGLSEFVFLASATIVMLLGCHFPSTQGRGND